MLDDIDKAAFEALIRGGDNMKTFKFIEANILGMESSFNRSSTQSRRNRLIVALH